MSKSELMKLEMEAVVQTQPGGPETLVLGKTSPVAEPTSGQVRIAVHATAVNRADTLQRMGSYPVPPGASPIIGLEAAGVIDAVGPNVTRFKPGDRVMALLPGGGYAKYALADERHVLSIPEGFTFEQAAAIPEVWITAYQLLHYIGKAKAGESVLIHAGASGVGTALIQLAKASQISALVTVGSSDKEVFTKNLGAKASFNYKTGSFVPFVKENTTNGRGVDLILDPVAASHWQQNAESLALDGRWILYGSMGGLSVDGPILGAIMRKRATLTGTTLRNRDNDYKADLIAAFKNQCLAGFSTGQFKPIIDKIFHIKNVAEAHRYVESNASIGKVILTWDEKSTL